MAFPEPDAEASTRIRLPVAQAATVDVGDQVFVRGPVWVVVPRVTPRLEDERAGNRTSAVVGSHRGEESLTWGSAESMKRFKRELPYFTHENSDTDIGSRHVPFDRKRRRWALLL